MKATVVRCATGLARRRRSKVLGGGSNEIELRIDPDAGANVRLKLENIESRIIQELSPAAVDLLEIAAYLYVADTSIPRGREDPFGDQWYRDLRVVVPVRDVGRWEGVRGELEELLTFLSGDGRIRLEFDRHVGKPHAEQPYIEFPVADAGYKGASTIVLFSGGIDSLAGALDEIAAGRVPLLVSHRSAAMRVAAQVSLFKQLQRGAEARAYGVNLWVNRKGVPQADVNQRFRSFLYLSLAFAMAKQLGIGRILYCENGISTFNLPLSLDRVGSRSTRTTNPRVISLFRDIMCRVLEIDVELENPFLFLSKADVMERIVAQGNGQLISTAVTCARTIRARRETPNCGTCYQCVMRRFAAEQRSLQMYDPVRVYAKDVFSEELKEGEERANAVHWVRFHEKISGLSDEAFEIEFPEITDFYSYLPGERSEALKQVFSLYRRNAREVLSVLKQKQSTYFDDSLSGKLPAHCLLSLIAERKHLENPILPYAVRVAAIAETGLRRAFGDSPPRREAQVQKQLDVILEAAGERLLREYPTLMFSIVKTTPDFSTTNGKLYVEIKLLKESKRRAKLVDELLADREKYTQAGAAVLFLVYQTATYIADPTELAERISRENVFCKVIG